MKKLRCTHTVEGDVLYYVDVISDSEQHAREMATSCVREKDLFRKTVDVGKWNVQETDSGYSGPARVADYGKQ